MSCIRCFGSGTEYGPLGVPRLCSCVTTSATKAALDVQSAGPQRAEPVLTDEQKTELEAGLGFADEGLSCLLGALPKGHRCVSSLEGAKRAVTELYAEIEGTG